MSATTIIFFMIANLSIHKPGPFITAINIRSKNRSKLNRHAKLQRMLLINIGQVKVVIIISIAIVEIHILGQIFLTETPPFFQVSAHPVSGAIFSLTGRRQYVIAIFVSLFLYSEIYKEAIKQ